MFQTLVAGDDKNTQRLMGAVLKGHGYYPILACDGLEVLKLLDAHHVDLATLDIMMPDMDGYELARQPRATDYALPILTVTVKQLSEDKRKRFIVGTDDHMTKPVDEEEMILHARALLRRTQTVNEWRITIGDVCPDHDPPTVSRGNESQTLLRKEFYLLYKLLSCPGKIFTRTQLMDGVWGMESQPDDNIINVHINRLRKRFEDYPELTIETIRGLGYKAMKNL